MPTFSPSSLLTVAGLDGGGTVTVLLTPLLVLSGRLGSLGSLRLVGHVTAISVVGRTGVANLLSVGTTIAGNGLGSTVT